MRNSVVFSAPAGFGQVLPAVIVEFLGRVSWTMLLFHRPVEGAFSAFEFRATPRPRPSPTRGEEEGLASFPPRCGGGLGRGVARLLTIVSEFADASRSISIG